MNQSSDPGRIKTVTIPAFKPKIYVSRVGQKKWYRSYIYYIVRAVSLFLAHPVDLWSKPWKWELGKNGDFIYSMLSFVSGYLLFIVCWCCIDMRRWLWDSGFPVHNELCLTWSPNTKIVPVFLCIESWGKILRGDYWSGHRKNSQLAIDPATGTIAIRLFIRLI